MKRETIVDTPDLLQEWDWLKNEERGNDPKKITLGSNRKVWWRCFRGHSFLSTPNSRSSGKGCPYCSGRKAIPGENDICTVNPQLAAEWDYTQNMKLKIQEVLPYSNKKAYWKCSACGYSWQATVNSRSQGSGCPQCARRFQSSFPEQAIYFYIKKAYPAAVNSYREIFLNNRELDIYVPTERIGIEYDGSYAHRDIHLRKDQKKYEICKQHGIRLIRICENIAIDKSNTCDILLHSVYDYRSFSGLEAILNELQKHLPLISDIDVERDKNLIQEQYISILKNSSLASVRPDIASEWDQERNSGLTPEMFKFTSGENVWWKCSTCGNSWHAAVYARTQGSGCPYCANRSVARGYNDFATRCPELLCEWAYEKNEILPQDIVWKSSRSVWWRCKVCSGEWKAKIYHRVNGSGCPFCAGQKAREGKNDISITHPQLLIEWNENRNGDNRPEKYKAGSDAVVWWRCSQCGNEWKTSIYNRTHGKGCPVCAKQKLKENEIKTRIEKRGSLKDWCILHSEIGQRILRDWDYAKNLTTPEMLTPGTKQKAWWRCHICGHEWESLIPSRKNGSLCPKCHTKE